MPIEPDYYEVRNQRASMLSTNRTELAQGQSLKSDLNDALLAALRQALRRL